MLFSKLEWKCHLSLFNTSSIVNIINIYHKINIDRLVLRKKYHIIILHYCNSNHIMCYLYYKALATKKIIKVYN